MVHLLSTCQQKGASRYPNFLEFICEDGFNFGMHFAQVVATGSALLARLKLYAVTAQAAEIAEQLVKAHMADTAPMGMQQVSKLINSLSAQLLDLSEQLLKSDSPTPPAATAAGLGQKQGSLQHPWPLPCLLQIIAHLHCHVSIQPQNIHEQPFFE